MTDARQIADGLSEMERKWFFATEWGSWLFMVGKDLATKGLTREDNGSITITPLGTEVRKLLENENG